MRVKSWVTVACQKHAEPAENYWSTWIPLWVPGENIAVDDSLALAFETLANLTSFA